MPPTDGLRRRPKSPSSTAATFADGAAFYGENKRVSNRRLHQDFPGALQLPTYREALAAIKADAD